MKIYTKTGDDGTTGLFGGERIQKDALRIESYGTVDELNATLGLAASFSADQEIKGILNGIQNDLFAIGADLATPLHVISMRIRRTDATMTKRLEDTIDGIDPQLKPLTHFILPGGSKVAAMLHVARNVCRRGERLVVRLSRSEEITREVILYLNRLSDLLFVLARWSNQKEGVSEIPWKDGTR